MLITISGSDCYHFSFQSRKQKVRGYCGLSGVPTKKMRWSLTASAVLRMGPYVETGPAKT